MNKDKFNQYQKFDEQEMNLEDKIIRSRNEQWKLKNSILKIGQSISQDQQQLTLVRHEKRQLIGRPIVELEEKEDERQEGMR